MYKTIYGGVLSTVRCVSLHTSAICFSEKIQIPARIQRSPTDILKALAGTISVDRTRPHYVYQDDPYLTPYSSSEKMRFALSKESGKKAARYIRDKQGHLFDHNPDAPIIKDYLPKFFLDRDTENIEASEELLTSLLNDHQIPFAIKVFEECKTKNIKLSSETLQTLLEAVCFTNEGEIIDPEWISEIRNDVDSGYLKRWNVSGVAEQIMKETLDNKSKAYCAMIRGMCKYNEHNSAWKLYQEALEKNLTLDSETFNSLIQNAFYLTERSRTWNFIQELLLDMVKLNIPPTASTLNSILLVFSKLKNWNEMCHLSLRVLNEFRRINIQPNLGTYYLLLTIYQLSKESSTNLLEKILNEIAETEFELQSVYDYKFFDAAMTTCKRLNLNWQLAQRVHKLLHFKGNIKFIGNYKTERYYYQNYLEIASASLSLEEFFELFDNYFPHIANPSQDCIKELLSRVTIFDRLDYVPKIWSICNWMEYQKYPEIYMPILNVLSKADLEIIEKPLASSLALIADGIWNDYVTDVNDERRFTKRTFSGKAIGFIISILIRCKHSDKAYQILNMIDAQPNYSLEHIPNEDLDKSFYSALEEKNFNICLICINMIKKVGQSNYSDYINAIEEKFILTDQQRKKLDRMH